MAAVVRHPGHIRPARRGKVAQRFPRREREIVILAPVTHEHRESGQPRCERLPLGRRDARRRQKREPVDRRRFAKHGIARQHAALREAREHEGGGAPSRARGDYESGKLRSRDRRAAWMLVHQIPRSRREGARTRLAVDVPPRAPRRLGCHRSLGDEEVGRDADGMREWGQILRTHRVAVKHHDDEGRGFARRNDQRAKPGDRDNVLVHRHGVSSRSRRV